MTLEKIEYLKITILQKRPKGAYLWKKLTHYGIND